MDNVDGMRGLGVSDDTSSPSGRSPADTSPRLFTWRRHARQCINQLQITADSADHDLLIRRRASTGRMTERKLECCFYSLSVFHLNERLTFRLFTMIGVLSVYY